MYQASTLEAAQELFKEPRALLPKVQKSIIDCDTALRADGLNILSILTVNSVQLGLSAPWSGPFDIAALLYVLCTILLPCPTCCLQNI